MDLSSVEVLMKHLFSGRWPWMLGAGIVGGFAVVRRSQLQQAASAARGWVCGRVPGGSQTLSARASFTMNCTADEAYRAWRDFEEFPRFMRHVDSVRVVDDVRSEWTIAGPLGRKIRWLAEIVEDRPGERIAWRSIGNSDVETRGAVEFRAQTEGRGTIVAATMEYAPPAGTMARNLFRVLGHDPEFAMREDLRRFKALVEAGEIPTIAGQPHGPRGLSGRLRARVLHEPRKAVQPHPREAAARIA
jgi:uncharacterized membrane protein